MKITLEQIRSLFARYQPKTIPIANYPGTKQASVLVPLIYRDGELHLLLTTRTHDVETHKGQISFPGGMRDETDADTIATALREAEEETGLPPSSVEVIGILDDFVTPTQFLITPVVGYIECLPELTPNTREVAEIFFVPLSFFADDANGRTEKRTFQGTTYRIWYFDYGSHCIWGATAGMIKHLLGLLLKTEERA